MNAKIATIAFAGIALAVVVLFMLMPGPAKPPAEAPAAAAPATEQSAGAPGYSADFGSDSPGSGPVQKRPETTGEASTLPPGAPWEDRLDELLTNEADNATTVRGLVSAMRGLPPEAQEEFVAHAVNLCEDEQYGLLEEIYYNSSTPKEVSETIFNDALNRPDEIKLPMLAKTLRNPTHPMAAESKEILEMYLDLEPGAAPPNGWEQAVNEYIREQGE